MFGTIFTNQTSRKIITAFGALFTNTTLVRYNANGSENERLVVPCAFGEKEKYWQSLQTDPQHDKHIQITLPQIAFDFVGLSYDAARKQQTTIQNFNVNASKNILTNYMGVPYNYEFELYIYVRNINDGFQIIEQILPFFTPDYTLRVNLLPSMNITKDIPLKLNDVRYEATDYEGDRESETRIIMFTLTFTAKAWLFGPVNSGSIIKEAITNLWDWSGEDGRNLYLVLAHGGSGIFTPGELVFQDSRLETSNATAIVVDWDKSNQRLLVDKVEGTFVTNETLTGVQSGAKWNIINYEIAPAIVETIDITGTLVPVQEPLGMSFVIGADDLGLNTNTSIGGPFITTTTKTFYNTTI